MRVDVVLLKRVLESYEHLDYRENAKIVQQFKQNGGSIFTSLHPHSYLKLRRQHQLISKIEYVLIDSSLMVYIVNKLLRRRLIPVCFNFTFPENANKVSFFAASFLESLRKDDGIGLIGSTYDKCRRAAKVISDRFGNCNIIIAEHGYAAGSEQNKLITDVIKLNPAVVVCGRGAVKQEELIVKLQESGWKGTGLCVGGFITQTAERINYYPKFSERYNLRWLYRIFREPRLIFRYTLVYPFAVAVLIMDCVKLRSGR